MYLAAQLSPGEQVLYSTTYSSRKQWLDFSILTTWVFLMSLIWHGLLLAYIPLALAIILCQWVQRRFTEYLVTDQRIIFKTGIFSVHQLEVPLNRIESILVDQTFTERMWSFGHVVFTGIGTQHTQLGPVNHPQRLRSAVSNQI